MLLAVYLQLQKQETALVFAMLDTSGTQATFRADNVKLSVELHVRMRFWLEWKLGICCHQVPHDILVSASCSFGVPCREVCVPFHVLTGPFS